MIQDEEERLRTAAFQNAQSILAARRRAEESLRKQSEWLRITLASIGDGVVSTDAEGRVTFLNAVAEALTGWTQAEALGRPLPEVFHIINEHTREPAENPALRALELGTIVGLANHTILISRDGTEHPIDDSAAPMRDENGKPIGAVLVFRDVLERKRAEETQARLAAIVEMSEDAIVSKSLDGTIRSWNAAAQRLFGYTPEEAVGQPITLIIPRELHDEERTILARLRRGERIEHYETVRLAKDGRRIDVSLSVSPIRDAEGHITGAAKIARNITFQKQAEKALRDSEARHRFLAELAAATQPLTDPDEVMAVTAHMLADHLAVDRCAYAEIENESVFVITGDSSRGVPSIVGRWPIAAFGSDCMNALLANRPFVVEDVDADPRIAPVDLAAYRATAIQSVICIPLHKGGKFTAGIAVHQKTPRHWTPDEIALVKTVADRCWEVLERARVTRSMVESRARLDYAVRLSGIGFWYCDLPFNELNWDEMVKQHFWLPADARVTINTFFDRLHPDDREQVRQAIETAIREHTHFDHDYRTVDPDSGAIKWIRALGGAAYGPDGAPRRFDGVTVDVTDRKIDELRLTRLYRELRDQDRRKDEFLALLAHELRNPLAPLRNGLQVMRLAPTDANAVTQARTMMDRQLGHMVRLIDDLLDISRISRNKMQLRRTRVLLSEVISSAVETARPAIEAAAHELHIDLPSEPVFLDADLTRLAQVFSNLLTNSAKYTERGGSIWLTAALAPGEVTVSVRDNGIGIPAESLRTIFDMFSQVDRSIERSTGGLGIGLALVKGLVEMHGGTVTATSPGAGQGSTFVVKLPVPESVHGAATIRPSDDKRTAGPRLRILVVDDNQDSAESMALMLKLLGNDTRTAHDGIEAIEVANTYRPEVILMDVGMPNMNGYDATRRIRELPGGRDMHIIALTGWGQEGDRERSRSAGCDGHLVKPVHLRDLEQLLASFRK